ncbi:MAG: Ig-like domain-containing protein, partial [Desulfurivibrionaceae bacterium]
MAIETDGGKGNSINEGSGQGQSVARAFVAADGTIVCPQCEAKLISVDVADVDLLLSFSDGTYVIIPNGALDALADPLQPVVFTDPDDSVLDSAHFSSDHTSTLGDLFKMVGVTKVAGAGSLRVVSENIDARGKGDGGDDRESRGGEVADLNDAPPSNEITSPPLVEASSGSILTGKGPGTGAIDPIDKLSVDPEEPEPPSTTPRPSVYKAGQKVEEVSDPTITLDANITADDIINIAEAAGDVTISGTVGGGAQIDDTVTLTVNGVSYSGPVQDDKSFSISVAGSDLAADPDRVIDASVTSSGTGNSGTDTEGYGVDLTAPVPEIFLDPITGDGIINIAEATGVVEITGTVGGDAQVGDTVTLAVNGVDFTGSVQLKGVFSVDVDGSVLVYAGDGNTGTVTARIDTFDLAGNPGSASGTGDYTIDLTPPAPTITLDADITGDGIIDFAEVQGSVAVTGSVGGDARISDWITLRVGGQDFSGQVFDDGINGLRFSIDVAGSALEADTDTTIDAIVESYDAAGNYGIGSDPDGESYTLDTTVPNPTITLDPDITVDDVINYLESQGLVAIAGSVGGDAKVGDEVTLTVGGIDYVGYVFDDGGNGLRFNIDVAGSSLVNDDNNTIDAIVTSGGIGSVSGIGTDSESYSLAIDLPQPTINLDAPIAGDDIINIVESGGNVTIQGTVGGDAKAGDMVTLAVSNDNFTGTYTGLVYDGGVNGLRFSIDVAGGTLVADEDMTIEASISTTDGFGNTGVDTDSRIYGVDLMAPDAPVIIAIMDDTAGSSANDGITSDQTLIIFGSAEADSSVEVFVDGVSIGYTNTDASGAWSFDHTGTILGEGAYKITARATDVAGNPGELSDPFSVIIDQTVNDPVIALSSDTGIDPADNITNDGVVNVALDADVLGWRYSVDGGANWVNGEGDSFTLSEGVYAIGDILVEQSDAAGNVSNQTVNDAEITIDQTVNDPVMALSSDTGIYPADNITNDGVVNVTLDKDVAGWRYSVDGGTNWVAGSGSDFTLSEGVYGIGEIRVEQTDIAGNVSVVSSNAAVMEIDQSVSEPIFILHNDTGVSAIDSISSDGLV